MGMVQMPLLSLECNGPAPTPLYKHCPAVSPGDYDQEEMEKKATAKGWAFAGTKTYCYGCAPAEGGAKPKAARQQKVGSTVIGFPVPDEAAQ